MKNFILLIFCVLFYIQVDCQQKIIEVAVSYDQSYADLNPNPEIRIDEALALASDIYSSFNIIFLPVKYESLGYVDLSVDPLIALAKFWAKPEFCYRRDLVLHFTGHLDGINGGASPSPIKLCLSNNINLWDHNGNLNRFVGLVSYQNSLHREAETTAHEIGHLLGLNHEDVEFCDDLLLNEIGVMCVGRNGNANEDGDELFKFSTSFRNKINNRIIRACVDHDDFDPQFVCSDLKAGWITDQEIELTCGGEGFKDISLVITNDETTRTFSNNSIYMDWFYDIEFQGEIENYNMNLVNNQSEDQFEIEIPDDFTLGPNQSYEFKFKINYDNIDGLYSFDPNLLQDIIWNSTVEPSQDGIGLGVLNRQLLIKKNMIELNGISTTQNLLDLVNTANSAPNFNFEKFVVLIDGTLTIDEDLFIEKNIGFKLTKDSRIDVVNGATFLLHESFIKSCENERWDKVFVEQGANVDFREVIIEGSTNGVLTEKDNLTSEKSDVMIKQCNFNNILSNAIDIKCPSNINLYRNEITDCNIAINIESESNISMLRMNNINNASYGINIVNQSQYLDVSFNSFTNCTVGLRMVNSSGIIENNIINMSTLGFVLNGQDRSVISNNSIGSSWRCIHIYDSRDMLISNNTIGTTQDLPEVAMSLRNVFSSKIERNPQILANRIGITALNSSLIINENPFINVNGDSQSNSGGLILTGCSLTEITDNLIYGTEIRYGIESNNSNALIKNNFVTMSPASSVRSAAAIRSMGGVKERIEANILYSYNAADGILLQNSSGNTIKCNNTDFTQTGLNILSNSVSQRIESNIFEGSVFSDMTLSSEIGDQIHLGNKFETNTVFAFLNQEQLERSEFYVNSSYPFHLPSMRTPDLNWFIDQPSEDEECVDFIGPNLVFFDDENALCEYYDRLKELADIDRKKYLINLGHILKYSKTKVNHNLPDCILLDSTYQTLCSYEKVIDIMISVQPNRLSEFVNENNNDLLTYNSTIQREENISNFQSDYSFDNSWVNRNEIKLDSLLQELNLTSCSDTLINILKDVSIAYIDLILSSEDGNSDSDVSSLIPIAQLCSSTYGEVVHMARAILLNSGDYTYYDTFDDCEQTLGNRRIIKTRIDVVSMALNPNPSQGDIKIIWNNLQTGRLQIFDAAGSLVHSKDIEELNNYQVAIEKAGVYLASFRNIHGILEHKKFVIIE